MENLHTSILVELNNNSLFTEGTKTMIISSPKYGLKHVMLNIEDYEEIKHMGWYYKRGYVVANNRSNNQHKSLQMHRCVMALMLGRELIKGEVVDHINHNTLDNRRENLRLTDHRGNLQNVRSRTNSSSQYVGVYWVKQHQKWAAKVTVDSKHTHGGIFKTEYCAALAYDYLARQTGEVKVLNFSEVNNLTLEQIKELDDPQYRPPSSKYKGVGWEKSMNKWQSYITINRKAKHIGRFKSEYYASLAYDCMVREHGLSRRLNHPNICLTLEQIKELDNSFL